MDEGMDKEIEKWRDGWRDEEMEGWMEGWRDGWRDERQKTKALQKHNDIKVSATSYLHFKFILHIFQIIIFNLI